MYGGPFFIEKYILYKKEQKYRNDGRGELNLREPVNNFFLKKESMQTVSRPRLSGKVAASAVGRGKCEKNCKRRFYTERY